MTHYVLLGRFHLEILLNLRDSFEQDYGKKTIIPIGISIEPIQIYWLLYLHSCIRFNLLDNLLCSSNVRYDYVEGIGPNVVEV